MNSCEENTPLVFVYLGNPPPKYAKHALRFAARAHSGPVVLLTDVNHSVPESTRYSVDRINDWYDPTVFASFKKKSNLDPDFMGGLWFHALERFFVLSQYMRKTGFNSFFHAELDVMVFDLSGVSDLCDSRGSGLFAVQDGPSRVMASLIYVNDASKFEHFLRFAASDVTMANEMEMMGRYFSFFPSHAHALPSTPVFEKGARHSDPAHSAASLGLFDAAAFGQWIFGVDPRLVRYVVKSQFSNESVDFDMRQLRFRFSWKTWQLEVMMAGGYPYLLRNLHVHSKILSRLRWAPVLQLFLWAANHGYRIGVTRRPGWWAGRFLDLSLGTRAWMFVKKLLSIEPILGFRLLAWFAHRSPNPIPNRLRGRMNSLLPKNPIRNPGVPPKTIFIFRDRNDSLRESPLHISKSAAEGFFAGLLGTAHGHPDSQLVSANNSQSAIGLREFAHTLFQSESDFVAVCSLNGISMLQRTWIHSGRRQALLVSDEKNDPARVALKKFFRGLDLRTETEFSSDFLVIQPCFFREIFSNDQHRIDMWVNNFLSVNPLDAIATTYGTWLYSRHRNVIVLMRK